MNNQNQKPKKQAKASAQAVKNGKSEIVVNVSQKQPQRQRKKPQAHQVRNKALNNIINGTLLGDKMAAARAYAMHVVNPGGTKPTGIPSQEIGMARTGLWKSSMAFDVQVNFNNALGNDAGRFGFVIRPDMGDASSPDKFKVAMVDNLTSWPAGFANPAVFLREVSKRALTVDPASRTLLQGPAMYFEGAGATQTAGPPVNNSPLGKNSLGAGTFTVTPTTDDLWNPNVGGATIVTFPLPDVSRITLPPGQYLLSLRTAFDVAGEANGSNYVFTPVMPASGVQNVFLSTQDNIGGIVPQDDVTAEVVVSVYETSGSFDVTWSVYPSQWWTTDVTISSTWARPDQLVSPAPGYPLDGGPVRKYVPVAMSVLVSFVAPELTVAGNIASALLPGNTCNVDVFVDQPRAQAGNPLISEDLRNFPLKYDGPAKDGIYTIWTPESRDDMILRSPTDNSMHDYPCIAVSGHLSGGTGIQTLFRVDLETTYQYTSDIQGFDLAIRFGSQDSIETALRLIQTFPRSGQNGKHWDNFVAFMRRVGATVGNVTRGAANFIESNQAIIKPLLTTAMML